MAEYTDEERRRPMEGRCNAHREDGTYCKARPMPNGSCHRHGGHLTERNSGVKHPLLRTGRVSKHLPVRIQDRHEEMLKDEELLSLNQEIALIDVRIAEVLESLDTEDGTAMWRRLRVMTSAYKRHVDARRATQAADTLDRIFKAIKDGADEFSKWEQVLNLVDARRKTVESERKRLVEMNQMITTAQAMVMLQAILDSIRKHVPDKGVLKALSNDLTSIFNAPTSGVA